MVVTRDSAYHFIKNKQTPATNIEVCKFTDGSLFPLSAY